MENNSSINYSSLRDEEIEALLWEYIDGMSEEKPAIEKLIADNTAWRAKYQELLQLHELVHASELEEPSMRFTKNVMEEISRLHIAPAAKSYINKKVIWGIAAFFISMIVGFLIYAIAQVNWSEGTSDAGSGNDCIQPGAKLCRSFKICQCPVCFYKNILCYFFRIFPAFNVAQHQRKHKALVAIHYLGIGLLVAVQYSTDDINILWSGRHCTELRLQLFRLGYTRKVY